MEFDIVIIGGGIIGSTAAHFLAKSGNAGNIVVIEPDSTYARASTPQGTGVFGASLTNSRLNFFNAPIL